MRGYRRRDPVALRWIARALLASAVLGACLVPLPSSGGSEGGAPDPHLRAIGPNDGELVNGRSVRLEIETGSEECGTIKVSTSGMLLRTVNLGALEASSTPLRTLAVDLDIETLSRLLAAVDFSSPATRLTFSITLYGPGGNFKTSRRAYWRPAAPWVQILEPSTEELASPNVRWVRGDVGGSSQQPEGPPVPVLLHAPAGDSFYFLVASQELAAVLKSPEEGNLQGVTAISSGVLLSGGDLVGVHDARAELGPGSYLVLWTFNGEYGWRRSQPYAAP